MIVLSVMKDSCMLIDCIVFTFMFRFVFCLFTVSRMNFPLSIWHSPCLEGVICNAVCNMPQL